MAKLYKVKVNLGGGETVEYEDVYSVDIEYVDDASDWHYVTIERYDKFSIMVRSITTVLLAMGMASNSLVLVPHKEYNDIRT